MARRRNHPEIGEAKQTVECIIKDANRATEVLDRIHRLVKKESLRTDALNINYSILEVIPLIHSEAVKNGVTGQRQLADQLPNIQGDRVQLQQVMINLIINAIQAMSSLTGGLRELHIVTESAEGKGLRMAVGAPGRGLSAESIQRLFEPFYTTKPNGMGMGL